MKSPRTQDEKDQDRKIGATILFLRRRDYNETQERFAKRIGVSRSHLANVESGRTPLTVRVGWKLCRELDLHPSWIVSGGKTSYAGVFPEIPTQRLQQIDAHFLVVGNLPLREVWPSLFWFARAETETVKIGLDVITPLSNTLGVKSEIEKLVARLKRATAKPGKKAELARFMAVAPPRVSEWLSGQEPGGEYALKLLNWVEQQERQK
jgi:transcriptional regulator with XRE-family HTH domain